MVWGNILVLYFRPGCSILYVQTELEGGGLCCPSASGLLLPVTKAGAFSNGPKSLLICCSLSCQLEEKSLSLMERLGHSASCDLICVWQPVWYSIK